MRKIPRTKAAHQSQVGRGQPSPLLAKKALQQLGLVGRNVIDSFLDQVFHRLRVVDGPDIDFEAQFPRLVEPLLMARIVPI